MELRPMAPNPVGAPLAAGANCDASRQGVFTALVQVRGIAVAGEAKTGPASLKAASAEEADVSTIVNGRPLRQNQLLESVQPPNTLLGPHFIPACRNMSVNTKLALK